jgi:hypothetical protein
MHTAVWWGNITVSFKTVKNMNMSLIEQVVKID